MPMGKVIQNTTSERQPELELRIYPGKDADFVLYDDDGVSYEYEKDAFTEIVIHWNDAKQELTIADRKGSYDTMLKEIVFKPLIVSEGYGVGSLTEYNDGDLLVYTGEALVWKAE